MPLPRTTNGIALNIAKLLAPHTSAVRKDIMTNVQRLLRFSDEMNLTAVERVSQATARAVNSNPTKEL